MIQFAAKKETVEGRLYLLKEGSLMDKIYDLDIPMMSADGKVFIPQPFIVYCSICGNVWAERQVDHEHAGRYWAKDMPCRDCGHGFLWDPYSEPWNKQLPLALLLREIELYATYYERGAKNYAALFPSKLFRRNT